MTLYDSFDRRSGLYTWGLCDLCRLALEMHEKVETSQIIISIPKEENTMKLTQDSETNDLRFLDQFFDFGIGGLTTARSLLNPILQENPKSPVKPSLRLNLNEDEKNFYARLDIPGVKREDIDIEMEDGELLIRALRKEKQSGENEHVFRLERKLVVGEQVDAKKIEAKLECGILQITLPKSEKVKPQVITVK